jgi:DNA polymerase I-like protein with 3'-5' exonuclease and polymerase domains
MRLVLDIECSVTFSEEGKTDPSPYASGNKLVSVGYKIIETGEAGYLFFHHKELGERGWPITINYAELQELLDKATLVIGHNLKFDMSWLYECGFKYDGPLYDTMIFEYTAAKGLKPQLKLSDCATRYGLAPKMDTMGEYLKKGINVDEMPMVELEEYGRQDIETTYQLYMFQRERYRNEEDIKTIWPATKLTNEALECLIDMERNGICIDQVELARVEKEFREEQQLLQVKLADMARSVIGDTPINLASPMDMTKLVYSLEVKDKNLWKETFNIGTEIRNSVKKVKYNRRYKDPEFRQIIKDQTTKVIRTDAIHCVTCNGMGTIQKYKKDKVKKKTGEVIKGEAHKNPNKCPACGGARVLYQPNGRPGGFRVRPISSEYATTNGFSTDKTTINDLIERGGISEEAQLFLTGLARLNALDTYLTSFVGGIQSGIRGDGLLHINYNQCITATGRLSSSAPNAQNFPRGSTFPVRKCFISRWSQQGGVLQSTDFSALEYRVAVMLARCEPGLKSILEGKDRHQLSAEIIFGADRDSMSEEAWGEIRQKAKSSTFQPLYSGVGQTEQSKAYAAAFFEEHTGIAKWHKELCTEAITKKQIVCPDGQIFAFPNAERIDGERVVGKTQITNYPVQHFATFSIAWAVFVYLWRNMKKQNVKSKMVMQTHDDIVVDVHPDEKDLMKDLTVDAFSRTLQLIKERFNYETNVPIGFEVSQGLNLMEKSKIYKG